MIDLLIGVVLFLSMGLVDLECTFYPGTDSCVGCVDDCLEADTTLEQTVGYTEA